MDTLDTLLVFAEWIDENGLMRDLREEGDDRSHEDLAKEFIEHWESTERAQLAGRESNA